MNKKELISRTAELMRKNNIRKAVPAQKTTLHITDDDGNRSDFLIKKEEKGVLFTTVDVTSVIDTCLTVIQDSISHGEDISIHGFGTLGVHHRAARTTKRPDTGEWVEVKARFVPKFSFGKSLGMAAKVYELSMCDGSGISDISLDECDEEADE